MEGEKIYRAFLETGKIWIKELDFYGDHQFKQSTEDSAWSIGQVYDHLVNGTYAYHFKHIEQCIASNGENKGLKKNLKGKLLFFFGSFPNLKIKGVPPEKYVPGQPESPSKMKDDFYRFIKAMQKTSKSIDTANAQGKTLHPTLGWLNALEWYKLIEMHFRHHLRQKARLDKSIRSIFKAVPEHDGHLEI